jgi:hypothetical protein
VPPGEDPLGVGELGLGGIEAGIVLAGIGRGGGISRLKGVEQLFGLASQLLSVWALR